MESYMWCVSCKCVSLPECLGLRSGGCGNSAASGWCCRRFPVCSEAAPPPPDAYEGCESHKASVCGGNTMRISLESINRVDLILWKQMRSDKYLRSVPCPRDVHMSLQHQVCCTHIILTAVFKELNLRRYMWRGQHV